MNSNASLTNSANRQQQAHQYLIQGEYDRAASLYEKAIEAEPDVKSHYWYLGLTLLLQSQEAEAHTTWLLGMVEGEPEQVEQWTEELVEVLETEAERRETVADRSEAWLIRQHVRELQPTEINNLLHLILLAIEQQTFTGEELTSLGAIELLQGDVQASVDRDLLLQVLQNVLKSAPLHPSSLKLASACLPHLREHPDFLGSLLRSAHEIGYSLHQSIIASSILELCLEVDPNYSEALLHLSSFYQNSHEFAKGIETAKRYYSTVEALPDKIFANHVLIRGLMGAGGSGEEARSALEKQESLLLSLIDQQPVEFSPAQAARVQTSAFFFPYLSDRLERNRHIQNQISQLCQPFFQIYGGEQVERFHQRIGLGKGIETNTRPLKIGYLSSCLRSHSVGWLARWLFQHHDTNRFEIHVYFTSHTDLGDPVQDWYVDRAPHAHKLGMDSRDIAAQIFQDEIDILIELDSITLDTACEVMAMKPAPIQVTWLGWDATGLPAVDYFIADPYVLPDSAQDYYRETIWRLPHTYIAVDGFEVAVPTIRREDLNIPSDAVVYFSGQRGYKRQPDTARLQMRILKEVPNSYLLIKGIADEEAIKNFFTQLAEEEGVDCDRLRFLPLVAAEAIHRANLGIADVVLDTYPYNGATTTLETLWMCIPLVTRVGEQFAARNSYTMMVNVGVTEGIAWTDEEYVEWGVRLGKDPALRQQISWRLRQSRQTSPLWNAKQFTREMEKAYEQMWEIYLQGHSS